MKAILISIRPQHTCNILNGIKWWEIRKKFPKDYVGWVYMYVTKALPLLAFNIDGDFDVYDATQWDDDYLNYNGTVIARFWCDRVEEIFTRQDRYKEFMYYETSLEMDDLLKESCLDYRQLDDYLCGEKGRAIHITKLEFFEQPLHIRDFVACKYGKPIWKPVSRPPQSWCYIEV